MKQLGANAYGEIVETGCMDTNPPAALLLPDQGFEIYYNDPARVRLRSRGESKAAPSTARRIKSLSKKQP